MAVLPAVGDTWGAELEVGNSSEVSAVTIWGTLLMGLTGEEMVR